MKHAKLVQILSPFVLLLLLAATSAYAGTVPPAFYSENAEYTVKVGPGSLTLTNCNSDGCGTGSASASVGTFLSASGETSGGPSAPAGVGAATLDYYWEVSGPPGYFVPVTVVGSLSTSATGLGAVGRADIVVSGFGGDDFSACSSTTFSCSGLGFGPPSLSFIDPIVVSPGQVNTIQMSANAGASVMYIGGSGSASASADPVISIDPTWLATHPGYSLEFSSGITNGATPEPSSLLLLGSGLLSLGYGMRRRLMK